jgi:hypothetical protein
MEMELESEIGKERERLWAHQSTPTKNGHSIFSGFAYGFA